MLALRSNVILLVSIGLNKVYSFDIVVHLKQNTIFMYTSGKRHLCEDISVFDSEFDCVT